MAVDAVMMGVGLGMDAMSVSAAIGVKWNGPHQRFRLGWHMGLFQFLMPCIGFAVGKPLASLLSSYGKYAAAALVFALGAKMLYEVLKSSPGAVAEGAEHKLVGDDPTRGWSLVAISVATSIDALVIGFSLGLAEAAGGSQAWRHILVDASVIGMVAGLMALFGVHIGKRLGTAIGRPAELAGAIVLMALAVGFLFF